MSDDDLRQAFLALKEEEREGVPDFRIPGFGRGEPCWKWRVGLLSSVGAVAVATVLCLGFLNRSVERESAPVAEIPFDEYSKVISREFFAASAAGWESPSDFLLNMEILTERER